MTLASRNRLCECGSGLRYKHCCGASATTADAQWAQMYAALEAQKAGRLDEAESLYRRVLAAAPDLPDALHMLGVVRLGQGDLDEAQMLVQRALDSTGWQFPAYRTNLGIILSKRVAVDSAAKLAARHEAYLRWDADRRSIRTADEPLVSVVIPSYNHGRFIERTLRSVYAQTYRNVELIVIDDGSQDASRDVIGACLRDCPFPHRFITRENRGSVATVNEGLALASGAFINILHSDDAFAAERFAVFVREVAQTGCDWGFSGVRFIDAEDRPIAADDLHVAHLDLKIDDLPREVSTGMALLSTNVSITTGNLFVRRAFWDRIGGLVPYKYNDDWEFCIRATRAAEPVYLPDRLFSYRFHGSNTILNAREGSRVEAIEILREYLDRAWTTHSWPNPFAPSPYTWGRLFAWKLLETGLRFGMEERDLRQLAAKA